MEALCGTLPYIKLTKGPSKPAAEAAEAAPEPSEPAPGTPEAAPAAEAAPAPEPLWPAVGERVAVGVEDLMHCLRLSETGVVVGPVPDNHDEVVVKLVSLAMLAPMRIPRSLLVPVGAPMSAMRFWDKCGDQLKREMLHKAGVRDPRDEVLPTTASVSLTMWAEFVKFGLRLDEDCNFKFVPPAFVKAYGDGDELLDRIETLDPPMSDADLEDFEKRQGARIELLTDWWRQNEVLLVCVCDEASTSSALLVVRKTPISLRCYEVPVGRGGEVLQVDWNSGRGTPSH